jgi:hypothetical protein
MGKRFILLLIVAVMSLSFIGLTAFADDSTDSGGTTVTEGQDQGDDDDENNGPKDKTGKMEKWLANKARIAEKKAQLAARKEAFFALKEQRKQDVEEQKALIKEQKALIRDQIHMINELSPHDRKKLKAEIKELWGEVRETQRYLWQIRQTAVDQAHEILGKVEVAGNDLSEDELQTIEGLVGQL